MIPVRNIVMVKIHADQNEAKASRKFICDLHLVLLTFWPILRCNYLKVAATRDEERASMN
jgi:hypothetical protein